jgi:hypothetical protein
MNVSVRGIKNSEIRKYKKLYAHEYMVQQPVDSKVSLVASLLHNVMAN